MGRLDTKVAVITGGGRGQGRSHALRLAREGADIVVCDIGEDLASVPYGLATQDDLDETVKLVEETGRRCVGVKADVRSTSDMQRVADRAMEEFGRIDIHLANAGILSLSDTTWDLTDEQWDEMIGVNLTGVFKSCRAVVPHMLAGERGGAIVITSSIAGLKPVMACTHYTAAKHGIVGVMKTLARELAPHMIRVNTIHPTGVDSPMSNNEFFATWMQENPELADPMRGNMMPVDSMPVEDVSSAVAWLVSDEAKWVTGVALPIDAGFLVR